MTNKRWLDTALINLMAEDRSSVMSMVIVLVTFSLFMDEQEIKDHLKSFSLSNK